MGCLGWKESGPFYQTNRVSSRETCLQDTFSQQGSISIQIAPDVRQQEGDNGLLKGTCPKKRKGMAGTVLNGTWFLKKGERRVDGE